MTEIRGRTFTNQERVEADGVRFIECTFESVSLVYSGGEHPYFDSCVLGDVAWLFEGPALKTVQLLQRINNEDPAGRFMESVFKPGLVFSD